MTIFRAILHSIYLFCNCIFPFQCVQATDHVIDIDNVLQSYFLAGQP
jgi:hypothetical protein